MYNDFAPISVQDSTNLNVDLFTSYAAISQDGRKLTIKTINKEPARSVTVQIKMDGFTPAVMTAYERSGDGKSITVSPSIAAPAGYTFKPYSQTLLVFQGSTAPGAIDWWLDRDSLMMITGGRATLHVRTGDRRGVTITSVQAAPGVTITARHPHLTARQPGLIDVVAGAKPGFYHFTVSGRTPSGRRENQSGWIVVGLPGSLPAREATDQ